MTPNDMVLYETIKTRAERGEPCPKNIEICALFGRRSEGSAWKMVRRIELAGLIRVFRGSRSRVVEIVETGQRTG